MSPKKVPPDAELSPIIFLAIGIAAVYADSNSGWNAHSSDITRLAVCDLII